MARVDMAVAASVVVTTAAEAVETATAAVYLFLAAFVAASNDYVQSCCILNIMQDFTFIPMYGLLIISAMVTLTLRWIEG